ncbi:O-antigen ligase family protein [Candidatus Fermentibacterales bacterium]|nr:O-antigen ligase family protein [Candidatus Fermentibacterales bacterium]
MQEPARAARTALILVLGLTAVLGIALLHPNSRSSILIKEFTYVAGGLVTGLILMIHSLGRSPALRGAPPKGLLLSFCGVVLYTLLRYLTGPGTESSLFSLWSLIGAGFLFIVPSLLLSAGDRNRVLLVLVCASALLFVYSILQKLSVHIFPWDEHLGLGARASGSLGNPNLLGSFAAAMAPVGLMLVLGRMRGRARMVVGGLFVALCSASIYASGTRGSLIGLVAGLGAVLALSWAGSGRREEQPSRPGRKGLWIAVAGLAILLAVLFAIFLPRLSELLHVNEGTFRVRRIIWSGTLGMFAARPLFGWGPGSFQIVFPAFRDPLYHTMGVSHNTLHAHCEYLEILSDLGLAGALLWGAVAFFFFRAMKRRGREAVAVGLTGGVVALLTEASVSVALRWPPCAMLLALLAGLGLCGQGEPRPLGARLRMLIAPGVPAVTALFVLLVVPSYRASMSAGHTLFVGKEIYLEKVEPALVRAGQAALSYEQTGNTSFRNEAWTEYRTAVAACSLSVEWCLATVQTDPEELGGWYALGSAYLSRAMVRVPLQQALSRLLSSYGVRPDPEMARADTRLALAAYDSLVRRAPNYAEIHNNMALVYVRLGMLDDALGSIRRAYDLYGHRRYDYLLQARALAPLCESRDGWHLLMMRYITNLSKLAASGRDRLPDFDRRAARLTGRSQSFAFMCMYRAPEQADSLAHALGDVWRDHDGQLADRYTAIALEQAGYVQEAHEVLEAYDTADADPEELLSLCLSRLENRDIVLPVHLQVAGLLLARDDDPRALDLLMEASRMMVGPCESHAAAWPQAGACFTEATRLSLGGPGGMRVEDLLILVTQLLDFDSFLATKVIVAETDFRSGTEETTRTALRRIWTELGGPQAAAERGSELPWLEDGAFCCMDSMIRAKLSADSTDIASAVLGLRYDYRVLSSFWWDTPRFSDAQRDLLFARIDSCRSHLTAIAGEEEARYLATEAMNLEGESTDGSLSDKAFAPFLERLRSRVSSGQSVMLRSQ